MSIMLSNFASCAWLAWDISLSNDLIKLILYKIKITPFLRIIGHDKGVSVDFTRLISLEYYIESLESPSELYGRRLV